MTQQVQEMTVPVQVLARVAELCGEGLPVPASTQIGPSRLGVWLTLHMKRPVDVDAWAFRLGVLPRLDPHVYTTPWVWQSYEIDLYDQQAEACWAAGVSRVHVWCPVDCDEASPQ